MTIQQFLHQLVEHCGVESTQITIDVQDAENSVLVTLQVPQEDSGLFIGHRGETIQSIQRLLRAIFQEEYADKKIHLNINEYREQRQQRLEEIAGSAAHKVLESGNPYTFHHFFTSQERFFIHDFIASKPEFAELESVSFGEGQDRRLSIQYKEAHQE